MTWHWDVVALPALLSALLILCKHRDLQLSFTAFPQGRHPWLGPGNYKVQCLLVFLSIVLFACLWSEFGACREHKIPGPSQGWRTLIHCGIAYIAGSIVDAMQITSFAVFIHRPLMDRHPWLRPGIWKVQCLLVFLSIVLFASLWTKFGACRGHKVPGPGQGWRDIEMLWPCQHCCLRCWYYANIEVCNFHSRPFPKAVIPGLDQGTIKYNAF